METIEIGRTGRPHGIRGDLALIVDEAYEEDLLRAAAVLIGEPPIPYFVESFRTGGKLTVKLENFASREAVSLLSNRPLLLPADQVTATAETEETPWDKYLGYHIEAEGYPRLGPILDIVDLPEHYLAEIEYEGKTVYIPLHPDLVKGEVDAGSILRMDLPAGLLDLGN